MKAGMLLTEIKGFSTLETLIALTIFAFVSLQLLGLLKAELSLNREGSASVIREQFAYHCEVRIRDFFNPLPREEGSLFYGTSLVRGPEGLEIDPDGRGLRYQGRRLFLNGDEIAVSDKHQSSPLIASKGVHKVTDLRFKARGNGLTVTVVSITQNITESKDFLVAL